MSRRGWLIALTTMALTLVAAPAWAHATFDTTQVPARSSHALTLRVPLERDAGNQRIEVLVPGAFSVTECGGSDDWSCELATDADGDTVVTLERNTEDAGGVERFGLSLAAPAEEGVYVFPVLQTYDDGTEAAWVGEPGGDHPAPRLQVGDETAEVQRATDDGGAHGEDSDAAPSETPSPDVVDDAAPPQPAASESPEPSPAVEPSPLEVEDAEDDGAVARGAWLLGAWLLGGAGALALLGMGVALRARGRRGH